LLSRWRRWIPPAVVFLLVVATWQLVVSWTGISEYLLPSPAAVLQAAFDPSLGWPRHIGITVGEIAGGFLLAAAAGVLLGVLITWSPLLSDALVPLLVFTNTLPKVAVAPLFLIWVGYGTLPNILMAGLIAFFPIVINTAVGLSQVDPELLDLARSLQASRTRIFLKIRLPHAVPYILGSLKVAVTMAVVGAVIGEFIAAQAGLGYVITTVQMTLNTRVAFAAIFWISVVGLALYGLVTAAGRRLAPWAQVPEGP